GADVARAPHADVTLTNAAGANASDPLAGIYKMAGREECVRPSNEQPYIRMRPCRDANGAFEALGDDRINAVNTKTACTTAITRGSSLIKHRNVSAVLRFDDPYGQHQHCRRNKNSSDNPTHFAIHGVLLCAGQTGPAIVASETLELPLDRRADLYHS